MRERELEWLQGAGSRHKQATKAAATLSFFICQAVGAALSSFLGPRHKCKSKTRNFYMCAANTKCDAEVPQEGESGRGGVGEKERRRGRQAVTVLGVPA